MKKITQITPSPPPPLEGIQDVKHFLAVASGKGGGEALSRELGLPLLGALPIDIELRKCGDKGVPLMIDSPDSDTARLFADIAHKLVTSFVVSEGE